MKSRTHDFNKQIILSELGSIIGAPIFGYITSLFTQGSNTISFFTVAGAILGSSALWLAIRIRDEQRRGELTIKKLTKDLTLYTPFASFAGIIFVHPVIFLATKLLLETGWNALNASLTAAILGTIVFLIIMNIYRKILQKKWDIHL